MSIPFEEAPPEGQPGEIQANLDCIAMSDGGAIDLARECLYRFLAAAFNDPGSEPWSLVASAHSQALAASAADLLREAAPTAGQTLGLGELAADNLRLESLLEELAAPVEGLRAEYDRVFGLVPARECPPYETEYHASGDASYRAQQLADVAGFYRAFGLQPSRARPERPDHLAVELEFMAVLLMKKRLALAAPADSGMAEGAEVCAEAERSFFRDHLAWWIPAFATGLCRKAGGGLYAALAQVLAAWGFVERCRFGLPAPRLPVQASVIERPEEQAGCMTCPAAG
jgi:TorA maturation chaperone TorD